MAVTDVASIADGSFYYYHMRRIQNLLLDLVKLQHFTVENIELTSCRGKSREIIEKITVWKQKKEV